MLVLVLVSTASAEWKEKVLYNFHGAPDGATPVGGVVSDEQGNLYGAAEGGANACPTTGDCGVVYQLSLPKQKGGAWTESILYTFKGDNYGDGANPQGGVILDAEGNLYGTTAYGGGSSCTFLGTVVGCGIVYELSPPSRRGESWTETVLYSFQGKKDGQLPVGDLVFDAAGNLYGATYFGGGHGRCDAPFHKHCGTIFELSPPTTRGGKWTEQVLYGFKGLGAGDGSLPNGGLILDSKGAIYGTTYLGGVQGPCSDETGCGIVFKLTPPGSKGGAWTKMTLHLFNGKNGFCPASGVVFDGAGNLYGTTSFGPGPYGLVFELKKPSGKVHAWEETVLDAFSGGNDGKDPIPIRYQPSWWYVFRHRLPTEGTNSTRERLDLRNPSWLYRQPGWSATCCQPDLRQGRKYLQYDATGRYRTVLSRGLRNSVCGLAVATRQNV
jgi:hypothetical protein